MNYPWLDEYLLQKPGAERDFKVEWQWHRYLLRGKMFAAVCTAGKDHPEHKGRTMVSLKCEPLLSELFREKYPDVVPGYYMDKRHWNSVYLDGAVPDDVLRQMCDMSYLLVLHKLPQKVQKEILGE